MMKKVKTLVSIATALVVLLSVAVPVAFGGEDTVSGSFGAANVAPTVGSVALWTTGGSPAATDNMTPQVEYNVKVAVTDNNTLDDLSTVQVTIFYDADGSYAAEDVPSVGHTQTAAILTWTNGGSWTIDAVSGGGSWSIVSGSCVTPTLTSSSGTFEFHFKPGKVAHETAGSDKWHIYAKADDGVSGDNHQDNLTMNWYGEMSAPNPSSVDFGSVTPGTDFGDPTKEGPISITYISNGDYDEQVKTTATWTGDPSGTATLNTGGSPEANEFSLKADDADSLPAGGLVDTGGVTIDDTGTLTAEGGDTAGANYLWLKLGTPFTDATYSGTITYIIDNGS